MNCLRCHEEYDDKDDTAFVPQAMPDPHWHAEDGRCYGCYLNLCFEIFGGVLEPCFRLGDMVYFADGFERCAAEDDYPNKPSMEFDDLPF